MSMEVSVKYRSTSADKPSDKMKEASAKCGILLAFPAIVRMKP